MNHAGRGVFRSLLFLLLLIVPGGALGACQLPQLEERQGVQTPAAPTTTSTMAVATITATPTTTPAQPAKATTAVPATPVPRPTATPPPATSTALPTATLTPVACNERTPSDGDLLVHVSRDYGLSRSYKPGDLVALSSFFPNSMFYHERHFRYVGVELATLLKENDLTLTEFLLEIQPEPCLP